MNTNFWKIDEKEIYSVRVAFEVLNVVTPYQMREGKEELGLKYIWIHMLFDIKMDGKCTWKDRLVAGGHKKAPPLPITSSIFVIRESVRISFLISGLNDIYICACGIGNEYFNTPCWGKLWTESGS